MGLVRQQRPPETRSCCAGKSAIHGWGAFAKQAHGEGDMLIEYAGELVRRSVADTRERRCYDKLVGAGTYVFGLNDDVCVDATRAGTPSQHCTLHSIAREVFVEDICVCECRACEQVSTPVLWSGLLSHTISLPIRKKEPLECTDWEVY